MIIIRFVYKAVLAFVLIFSTNEGKSQTTLGVDLTLSSSTLTTSFCTVPVTIWFNASMTASGYTSTTGGGVPITIDYGDGTGDYTPTGDTFVGWGACISHTYTSYGTYYLTMTAVAPDGNTDTATIMIVISPLCGVINGRLYNDNNNNCIQDVGETPIAGVPVEFYSAGILVHLAFTDSNGDYSTSLPAGITYDVRYEGALLAGLIPTCPASGYQLVTPGTSGPVTADFGYYCPVSSFNLYAFGSGWGFTPGEAASLNITGGNTTCLPTNATITVTLDPHVSYIGTSGIAPSTIVGNTLTWNVVGLQQASGIFGTDFVQVLDLTTDTIVTVGDTVCFTISITPTVGDMDSSNNTQYFCMPVLASWDPNIKTVQQGNGPTGAILPGATLDYTVHFQNTGNFPASNIYVMDTLDANLDWTTFEVTGFSHPMSTFIINDNVLKFRFDNINLMDSTTNEPLSHGYVKYRVRAKWGLLNGNTIENTGHIFFDYNPAVVTNTTLNTVDLAVSVNEEGNTEGPLKIFPNPASNSITLVIPEFSTYKCHIIDATGKAVMMVNLTNKTTVINIESLPAGIYQIVVPDNMLYNSRFVKSR